MNSSSLIWIYALVSVAVVSLISLIGIFTLSFKKNTLSKLLFFFVSFSTGALLGDAFIHLLPEAFEKSAPLKVSLYAILGMILFFMLEKFIHWRHCHVPTSKEHPHPYASMNLIGDSFHNFI